MGYDKAFDFLGEEISMFLSAYGFNNPAFLFFILAALFSVGFRLIFHLLIKVGKKISSKTKSRLDDEIIEEVNKKSKYLALLFGFYIALQITFGNIEILGLFSYNWFLIFLLLITGLSLVRIAELFLDFYVEEIAPKTGRTIDREGYVLIKNLIKYSLLVLLALTLLSIAGVDVTPMIAGLGVAGIAVAMALQDTLSNFFAGIYILLDRPIKLGDYVKIGEVEGVVVDVGWRSTKIITWNNIQVVIPNKKVADEIIVNYFKPTDPIVHVVDFGVEYGSDVEKVKQITLEVIEELKKEDLLSDEQPSWVSFREFGDSSLNFKVGLCVSNYRKRYSIQAVFLEKLYNRFNKEGIGIPFPTRTVYLKEEPKEETKGKPKKNEKSKKRRKK